MRGLMISKFYCFMIVILLYTSVLNAGYIKAGTVESLRADGYVTVIFDNTPDREDYFILNNDKVIGNITALKAIPDIHGKKRYLCSYRLAGEEYRTVFRSGLEIGYYYDDKEIDKRLTKNPYIDSSEYKPVIVSLVDSREMVLVPEGKFFFGCSNCDDDEFPEQTEFLGFYYIDKFEVSNSDYKKYADTKGEPYPEYWTGQVDDNGDFRDRFFSALPVIVTYYEASGYAAWAGKRLPTEKEWEKSARPPSALDKTGKGSIYSWGSGFREGLANTDELWVSGKTGESLKKIVSEKYMIISPVKGYLPVEMFEIDALSFYGVANLDGNALEWTSDWYQPYSGNRKSNINYGAQYKVIRGGSYFFSKDYARITDRKIGGIPDLYRDRIAGFRCVKNASEGDKIK